MDRRHVALSAVLLLMIALAACSSGGGNSGGTVPTGSVSVSLTDGPGDYDHVWITVGIVGFHQNDNAGPLDSGWQWFSLSSPVTVDLLMLSNGSVGPPLWDRISLPAGQYKQLLFVLPDVGYNLLPSAAAIGLNYNNEVVIGGTHYPLRVPDARHGIKLSGNFHVTEEGHLRLALDFNVDNDVVEIDRNGKTEYLLKPRLEYFDLDDAGAIVSQITPTAAIPAGKFVIKAEQVGPDGVHYVVRRFTSPDPATGRFVLYPLWPGTYDLVLRGLDHKTMIIRGVSVTKGTNPSSGATVIPPVTMIAAAVPDYTIGGTITSPTGAWVEFFQELVGGVQYPVRFRHFNPFTGQFANFPLSGDDLLVGQFNGSVVTGLTATTPVNGSGAFNAVARAVLFEPSSAQVVTSSTGTVSFNDLSVKAPAVTRSVSGLLHRDPRPAATTLDRGVLFAVHGGMVVHAMSIDSILSGGTPTAFYTMNNLPGGTSVSPFPWAVYGMDAIAWSSTTPGTAAGAIPHVSDLRTGDDIYGDIYMILLGP